MYDVEEALLPLPVVEGGQRSAKDVVTVGSLDMGPLPSSVCSKIRKSPLSWLLRDTKDSRKQNKT